MFCNRTESKAPHYPTRKSFFSLAAAIALCLQHCTRARGEDYGSYLHEFYREDDHRISVDADTLGFDVGLGEHVRLTGQLVQDAISGATPSGAPPQAQWPFQTFNGYYNKAYNQLFQYEIYQDPSNTNLYNAGLFSGFPNPWQAYTNYVATNNPQLGMQASNNATASYYNQSTNKNLHNTTVPLTQMHDQRRAISLGTPIAFGIHQFTPLVAVSMESDYHSYGAALNYQALLNNKNTTLNAGWSHNCDRVRDNNLIWEGKVSDDFLLGLNQLLTPKSYITFDFTYGQEYGYLSDPYRGVMPALNFPQPDPSDPALLSENRPRRRTKEIFYTSYSLFIEPLDGSAEVGYRFFHDSYGIFAHTFETSWHQKIGRNLYLTPGFRYYIQTAANFYYILVPDFNNLPAAYSSDYRLSELQTFNFSIALNYRIQKHFSIDLGYSRYIMQGLDGATSQSAFPSANIYTIGGRIWF